MRVVGRCKGKIEGAECGTCPLQDRPAVVIRQNRGAALTVLGEAPGINEEEQGDFFVGATGRFLQNTLASHGMLWPDVNRDNVLLCRPDRQTPAKQWKQAIACCAGRLQRTLGEVKSTAILALGKRAMHAVTGRSEVAEWGGAPIPGEGRFAGSTIVATFHPAFAMRKGKRTWLPAIAIHIERAVMVAQGRLPKWEWPRVITDPGPEMVATLRRFLRTRPSLGVDIENCRVGGRELILAIGLATRTEAISTPWDGYIAGKHGEQVELAMLPYGVEVARLVRQILADPRIRKSYQNGKHDIVTLRACGIDVEGYDFELLFAHCVVAPNMAHSLGWIAGLETSADAWKAAEKLRDVVGGESFMRREPERLRVYNGRDGIMVEHLKPLMLERLGQTHRGMEQYRTKFEVGKIALEMIENGVAISEERIANHKRVLGGRIRNAVADLNKLTMALGVGEVNHRSSHQLRKLYFEQLKLKPVKYSDVTGDPSLDSDALTQYLGHESTIVRSLSRVLLRIRQWEKLVEYITDLDIDKSGSVPVIHLPWNAYGTITGRWSCWLHMIPKAIETRLKDGRKKVLHSGLRDIIVARPGNVIVRGDFKALELRIVAMLAGMKRMVEMFMRDEDVHTQHAIALFGHGNKDFVPSKSERTRIKNFVYNANYLGRGFTIWRLLVAEGIDVSLKDVEDMMSWYFETYPQLPTWQRRTVDVARAHGYAEDVYSGRRRHFYGQVEPTEAVNFPVQSDAAHLADQAILKLRRMLGPRDAIIIQKHDEIAVEGPAGEEQRLGRMLSEAMTQRQTSPQGTEMVYTVDLASGPSLGEGTELRLV